MDTLTIGKLARTAGVGVETIRFYERINLIDEPPRSPTGYRQYSQDAVGRLRFIRSAKRVGFSLQEIRELLELKSSAGTSASAVREIATKRISEIGDRIAELREIRRALRETTERCDGEGSTGACVILAALDSSADG